MNAAAPEPSTGRPEGCPDDAELRQLLLEEGTSSVRAGWVAHIGDCSWCCRRLDVLAGIEHVVPARVRDPASVRASATLRAVMERAASREFSVSPAELGLATPSNSEILTPPDRPGTLGRFAGYDVLERIASGGMGVVFKAQDPSLNRIVAIKVLAPVLAMDAGARARFLREARAAAAVNHEHVVAIYAVGEHRGLPFLVMQFISGVSLETRWKNGPLTLPQILRIGHQCALGLAAAHAQGLIHRDIKPGNILLENGVERVKITDFGLARAADAPALTRPGVVAGTPEFMSPEQARGERVDARSDLFSLGAVLYVLATGTSPFAADSTLGTLRRVSDHQPPPVQQVNPAMPEWLGQLIARLMEKDPRRRWESALAAAQVLEKCLAETHLASDERPVVLRSFRSWPPAGSSPRLWGGLALAGAVLVAWLLWRGSFQPTAEPVASSDAPFRLCQPDTSVLGFTNLTDATTRVTRGSYIELAFDGPQEVSPIAMAGSNLELRAAPGRRPILIPRESGDFLLRCEGAVTLEGIEFRVRDADSDSTTLVESTPSVERSVTEQFRRRLAMNESPPALIQVRAGKLLVRNCRFVMSIQDSRPMDGVLVGGSDQAEFTGCEFYSLGGVAIRWRAGKRFPNGGEGRAGLTISNCCFFSLRPLALVGNNTALTLKLERNSFVAGVLLSLGSQGAPSFWAERNLFGLRSILDPRLGANSFSANRWHEERNLFTGPPAKVKADAVTNGTVGPQSRIVQLGIYERLRSATGQPRRMTPDDFRITEADAQNTPGIPFRELREYGCRPETVGPGGRR